MNYGKRLTLIVAIAVLGSSCKDDQKASAEESQSHLSESLSAQTYAEISVRKGGEWEGSKYVGGHFENVEELQIPAQHTDGSKFLRYEGPGWENSQVAYRLYLDWRNAIDIFGKKVDTMVLSQVGHDSSPSYHDEAPWGLDILKAGKSLGLGGFGRYNGKEVLHFEKVDSTSIRVNNSEETSTVEIFYKGWNTEKDTTDLNARLSIFPEDRFTKVELAPSEAVENIATGIVKFDEVELVTKESAKGAWGYIATYGAQTLVDEEDLLGMAIFYNTEEVKETLPGPHDHLVVFEASQEPLTYYFLAAWEQEKSGFTTRESFFADLDAKLEILEEKGKLEP